MIMHYLFKAIDCLNPLVHIIGLGIAIWAFRRSFKRGYLVVAVYFALSVFALVAMPHINRALAERRAPDISTETREKMNKAINEAVERVLEEEGHPPIAHQIKLRFPIGPILLVLGLWLVARREDIVEPKVRQVSFEAAPSAPPDEPST